MRLSAPSTINRAFRALIRDVCCELGITCQSFDSGWLTCLSSQAKTVWLAGSDPGLNSSSVARIIDSKSACSRVLSQFGVSSIPHVRLQEVPLPSMADTFGLDELQSAYGDEWVVKPDEGTGGRDVQRCSGLSKAIRVAEQEARTGHAAALCPWWYPSHEIRVVVFFGAVLCIFEKRLPFVIGDGKSRISELRRERCDTLDFEWERADDFIPVEGTRVDLGWRRNVGQGAYPNKCPERLWSESLDLALRAASAIGANFCSVDVLFSESRQPAVLEVNSRVPLCCEGPGITDAVHPEAHAIWSKVLSKLFHAT